MTSAGISFFQKEWETEYFQQRIFQLNLPPAIEPEKCLSTVSELLNQVDFDLVETNLNLQDIILAETLENLGFRLVDSRASFITLVDLSNEKHTYINPYPEYTIGFAAPEDRQAILDLNTEYVVKNPGLVSRYKNINYFPKGTSERYFTTWINYCLDKENAFIATVKHAGKVAGFFIFEEKEKHKELPLFKGILAAVDRAHQGKKLHLALQYFQFVNFGYQRFYLDNTTQLSNIPVLKNHVRSNRNIHKFSLTFLLKKSNYPVF